jgi:4-methyl-5(b-hydroxyethyl)-thiazole monophosphate biosynthesis
MNPEMPLKKVLLLLARGFEAYEASAFTDVMGWARTVCRLPVHLVTAGRQSPVACTWNFTVVPELLLGEVHVQDYAALALPGGFSAAGFYEDAFAEDVLRLIREFNAERKMIASVCVGALALAKSGILEGRKATTYHLQRGLWMRRLRDLGARVVDDPMVVDGRIITSSSPATALPVAFTLLERLTTPEDRARVEREMGFSQCPPFQAAR